MVDYSKYKYTEPSIMDLCHNDLAAALVSRGQRPKILKVKTLVLAPAANAEIRTSYTHELDGVASPVKLDVKSADAKDTSDGVGARTIGILGISATSATGTFSLYEETVIMNGTTAVETARYYKRVNMMRVITAGSELDPAGAITLHEKDGTTKTYATLTAGQNFTNNQRMYWPSNYTVHLHLLVMRCIPVADSAAAVLGNGAVVTFTQGDGTLTDPTINKFGVLPVENSEFHVSYSAEGNDDTFCTFSVQSIDTDVTTVPILIKAIYYIIPNTAALLGVN